MKNYYKILGVKETASEEEIREKWIKLMRKLHPDWHTQEVSGNEKVKEINEAYQILKFSSTRMKYDLKKAYEHKKRRSYIRRFSFPISMLTALLIISTVYLKNSTNNSSIPTVLNGPNDPNGNNDLNELNGLNGPNEHNVLNGPNVPNDPNAYTHQRFNASTLKRFNGPNDPNGLNGPNELNDPNGIHITPSPHQRINATGPTNVKKSINAINPIDSKKVLNGPNVLNRPNVPNGPNEPNDQNGLNAPNNTNAYTHLRFNEPNDLNGPNVPNEPNVLNVSMTKLPNDSMTKKPIDLSHSTLNLVTDSSSQLSKPSNVSSESSVPNKLNVPNVLNERFNEQNVPNGQNGSNVLSGPNVLNGLNGPNVLNGPNGPNEHNELNSVRMAASTHQPSMATEQEIKQFFANYTERYIQKDLDGFLSLFSLRAVQNHQDGWEGIRKIYGDFFSHSKDIRYYLEDTKVEFYQNGLEVKAHYELVQTLKRGDEKKTWRGPIRWVLIKEQGALKILSLDYQH